MLSQTRDGAILLFDAAMYDRRFLSNIWGHKTQLFWFSPVIRTMRLYRHLYPVYARCVCGAGSMKRSSVRPSVRPSVCPFVCMSHRSTAAAACGGFAAECPVARSGLEISIDSRRRRSAANAGSVTLTAQPSDKSRYRLVSYKN